MRSRILLILLYIGTVVLVVHGTSTEHRRFGHASQINKNENKLETWWVDTLSFTKNSDEDDAQYKLVSKKAFASGIAFLTGFADVFCFRMNNCYANMMTGNTIKLATALGELRSIDALFFLGIVVSHGLGNLFYRSIVQYHQHKDKVNQHVASRRSATPIILALFSTSDFIFHTRSLQTEFRTHIFPLALGFGLLNSATTDALGGTNTFAMTGHLSKIMQGTSDRLFSGKWRSATKMSVRIFIFFFLGVVVGAILNQVGPQQVMTASGLGVSFFLLENRVPFFTIVGGLTLLLMQLYDHPVLPGIRSLVKARRNRLDISVKEWAPPL